MLSLESIIFPCSSFSFPATRKIKVWDLVAALDPRAPAGTLCLRTLVVRTFHWLGLGKFAWYLYLEISSCLVTSAAAISRIFLTSFTPTTTVPLEVATKDSAYKDVQLCCMKGRIECFLLRVESILLLPVTAESHAACFLCQLTQCLLGYAPKQACGDSYPSSGSSHPNSKKLIKSS